MSARRLSYGYSYGLGSEPWYLARSEGPPQRASRATVERTLPLLREIGRDVAGIGDLTALIALRSGLPVDQSEHPDLSPGLVQAASLYAMIVANAPGVDETLVRIADTMTDPREALELAQTLWDVDRRDDALQVCRRMIEQGADPSDVVRGLLKSIPMFNYIVRSLGDRLDLSVIAEPYLLGWVSAAYPAVRPEVRRRLLEARAHALRDVDSMLAREVTVALVVAGLPKEAHDTADLLGDGYAGSRVAEAAISIATSPQEVRRVLDRLPDDGSIFIHRGAAVGRLIELGDVDAAVAVIERSPAVGRQTADAQIGAALTRRGAEGEAIGLFARCVVGDLATSESWSAAPVVGDARLAHLPARLLGAIGGIVSTVARIRRVGRAHRVDKGWQGDSFGEPCSPWRLRHRARGDPAFEAEEDASGPAWIRPVLDEPRLRAAPATPGHQGGAR